MDALHREFANEVRAENARNRFSQQTLSAKTGLSLSSINRLLNAEKSPTLGDLNKLGSALNIRPSELVRRAEEAAQNEHKKGQTK